MGEAEARERGMAEFTDGDVVLGPARELEQGWYFPCIAKSFASTGVIVNKQTGTVFRVMRGSSLDRDPTLYDLGYQSRRMDLVVLAIDDVDEAVRVIQFLRERVVDTYYRFDRVWRVGRTLTEDEVRERLATLPAVFTGDATHHADEFENAREKGFFEFKLFDYRPRER